MLSESEAEAEEPANRNARSRTYCHWFILPLLLAIPTMQFSLDRKHASASDSVGLIVTIDRNALHLLLGLRLRR